MKMRNTLLAFGCLLLAVTVGQPFSLPLAFVTPGVGAHKGPGAALWSIPVRLTMITDLAIAGLFASQIPVDWPDRGNRSDRAVRATGQEPVLPVERLTVAAGPTTGVPSRAPARLPAARPTEPLEAVRFARGGSPDLWSVLHGENIQPVAGVRLTNLNEPAGEFRHEVVLRWKSNSKEPALRRVANCELGTAVGATNRESGDIDTRGKN
ncbi:MAG: hypothetical protein ACR2L2_04540 [Acidobacteriota bacterium]